MGRSMDKLNKAQLERFELSLEEEVRRMVQGLEPANKEIRDLLMLAIRSNGSWETIHYNTENGWPKWLTNTNEAMYVLYGQVDIYIESMESETSQSREER